MIAFNPVIDIGSKVLGEYINDSYCLTIESLNNELECTATISVQDLDTSIAPTKLISILQQHNIAETIDLEEVAIFCAAAAQGENPQKHVVARGLPPQHGKDGWFELLVSTGPEQCTLEEDARGRIIDYKSIQSFSNVSAREPIGIIHPPSPGTNGHTITKQTINAIHGKPSPVAAGSGTLLSEDGTQILANREGRVIFEKGSVSVVEELLIKGDIDMNIGHIRFNGFVSITGDVLDDFNVTAKKGINIDGAVGKCQIDSAGAVSVVSMAGKGKGLIRCQGNFTARYLNQATIECHRDITILQEARNSIMKATGKISAEKGLITGGESIALEGIEAMKFGNLSGIKTYLTAGIFFPETDRLRQLKNHLESTLKQTATINTTLTNLKRKPITSTRVSLREAVALRIEILSQRLKNLDQKKKEVSEELSSFKVQEHPTANARINALNSLLEGVVISLGETTEELKYEVAGPVSINEDAKNGGLRYQTYRPLTDSEEDSELSDTAE
jgi:uncharacterized protein (DUF342 family)